ncbi:BQ5605_C052g12575 [Microbotryum silenes-dioicae]|uniref:BQ5605_C052g12575 protein n=1 Tax=Microbotryum silenes-dioicae TaxID=796604 RepID=A0A2X0PHG3_9BASI|nr:BQ5605_C052g12575 [Microbotryum silenes-dioicae]
MVNTSSSRVDIQRRRVEGKCCHLKTCPYSLQSFHDDPFGCRELEADLSRKQFGDVCSVSAIPPSPTAPKIQPLFGISGIFISLFMSYHPEYRTLQEGAVRLGEVLRV